MRSLRRARAETVLSVVAVACLCVIVHYAYIRASSPFQIDYEEGNILNAGNRLINGQSPYPDPQAFPYTINPYGPVGYQFTRAAIDLFGLDLLGPRIFVLVAGMVIVFLLTVLTWKLGGFWQIGFALGVLYLCSPLVRVWFPLLRVDFWAVMLSLLGLYMFVAFPRAWPIAAVVFAIAILTKHTALAGPAACVLELIASRKGRRASAFAGLTVGTVVVSLAQISGNPFFHLLHTHPDPYNLKRLVELYALAVESSTLLCAVVIYGIVFGVNWNNPSRLAWLYLSLCSVTSLSAAKLGSETNHFLEWTAAVCLVASLSLSDLIKVGNMLAKPFVLGFALLIPTFAFMASRFATQTELQGAGCRDAYAFVRSFSGNRVLSEDVAALVLGNKPVLISNPFVTTQLKNTIDWSAGTIEHLVERQYFQLIMLGGEPHEFQPQSGRWSVAFIKALREQYRPERQFDCYPSMAVAFVPNSR
jgi:Dolichyl-phosphate-mannose-protein mannosyltransferase